MKRYVRASANVKFEDQNGKYQSFYLDLDDPRDLYLFFDETIGSDFTNQFQRELEDWKYIHTATPESELSESMTNLGFEMDALKQHFGEFQQLMADYYSRGQGVTKEEMSDLEERSEAIDNIIVEVGAWIEELQIIMGIKKG